MKITSPSTREEFEQYYDLRWRILRQPWNQPRSSEKDELEESSYHVMAIDDNDNIIGCGRLNFVSNLEAQIRYMAVDPSAEKQGIGKAMLVNLETYARQRGVEQIILNARENAVGFYEKLGYQILEKSHLLFGSIQHYKMHKFL